MQHVDLIQGSGGGPVKVLFALKKKNQTLKNTEFLGSPVCTPLTAKAISLSHA